MGVGYCLYNQTRREYVGYAHIDARKMHELAGNPVAAAITTWYLLQHRGDAIAFVSDTHGEWPFSSGSLADSLDWPDVTRDVVDQLIRARILEDHGREDFDPAEPDVYIRKLRNCFMRKQTPP